MHLVPANVESQPEVLHQFIRENPLGISTTAIRSPTQHFIQSSHIPWVVDSDAGTGKGRLRGHIARPNPQSKAIIESLQSLPEDKASTILTDDVLILFNGPAHHYVTPKWYVETKPSTGKVVPTWDYEAVQVYGRARIYHDSSSAELGAFLSKQLDDLTRHTEGSVMGYADDRMWKVSDAPERYIELLKKNIIGIEVEITDMAGRFKMSQEKKRGDRDGVINGFAAMECPVGAQLADLVEKRADWYDAKKKLEKEKS